MILGGRAPKLVHIVGIFSKLDLSSLLNHKIVANIGVTMFDAKLDKDVLVVQKHFGLNWCKRNTSERHRSNQRAMVDESVKQNQHRQKINNKPSKHGIGFSKRVVMHIRTLRGCLDEQHRGIKQQRISNVNCVMLKLQIG